MGKKRGKSAPVLTAARPFPTRDLEQITDDMIAWYGAGSPSAMSLPAVYASVRLIASTINQLPVEVENGDTPEWVRSPRRWGGALDLNDLVQFIVVSMATKGAAYLQCTRGSDSWRLDALHAGSVQPRPSSTGVVSIDYLVDGSPMPEVPAFAVEWDRGTKYLLHIPYLVTPDHPEGLSPLASARLAVDGYASVERQAATLLGTGTYSGGRLETEQDITSESALRYQSTWVENRKLGNLPVLGGGLKYINDLIDPADAQWLESRQYNNQQIAMMFGIPPDYLGMSMSGGTSSLSYQNSQDNDRRFRRNCLAAFTQQIGDSLSILLPPGRNEGENQRLTFDYTRWEGEGDAPQQQPDGPAVDDPGQRGRNPDDRGDSGPVEQADHLRRDTGVLRAGVVQLGGSNRETPALEPRQERADRPHHSGEGLKQGSGDLGGDPSDGPRERRDDAPKRRFDQRFVRWLRPDRADAGEGRGPVHQGAPARTITYPVAGIPAGSGDSNER